MNHPAAHRSIATRQHLAQAPINDLSVDPTKEIPMTTAAAPARRFRKPLLLSVLGTLLLAFAAVSQAMVVHYAPSSYNALSEYGLSGGSRDASRIYGRDSFGNRCTGFIFSSPDHVITVRNFQAGMTIEVEAWRSSADTTLVVIHRQSGTVYCDDDSGRGLNPMVSYWNMPAGTYEVYVGSYWSGDYHDYTLYLYD